MIIEAAEKAAAGIIDDAEAQARNYLQESRVRADQIADLRAQEMSTLADALIERAEAVKRQSDELLRALDQAKLQVEERFRGEAAVISTPEPDPRPPSPPPVREAPPEAEEPLSEQAPVHHLKPVGQPSWEAELPPSSESPPIVKQAPDLQPPGGRPGGTPPSDGARLLATQMAVAGSSRAEIEGRLQNEFGIQDAGPMLDAILGREG